LASSRRFDTFAAIMSPKTEAVSSDRIEDSILIIRGHKVILDSDLAVLYGVSVGRLNEAVKRNRDRFPVDFMFQLTSEEFVSLRSQVVSLNLKSQIAISSSDWGGRRHPPFAFTEHGVAMLSSVLRSKRAVRVNIEIMRAFVRLFLDSVNDLNGAKRLNDWNGLRHYEARSVQGRLRRHPPADGITRAEEKKNRISGGRKDRRLRTTVVADHFDVLRILKTCRFPLLLSTARTF